MGQSSASCSGGNIPAMKLLLVLLGLFALVASDGFHRNGRGGHGRSLSNRRSGRNQARAGRQQGHSRGGRGRFQLGRRGRQEEVVGGYEAPAADAYGAPPVEDYDAPSDAYGVPPAIDEYDAPPDAYEATQAPASAYEAARRGRGRFGSS